MRTPELQNRINNALSILNASMPRAKRKQSWEKRDLTQEQFEYRARKAGWQKVGHPLIGYWSDPAGKFNICVHNAGSRRRN
jgi:hypothetical protein